MRRLVVRLALLSSLLVANSSLAQTVNVTGTWSGQFSITDRCDNGQTFTSNGTASAGFTQTESSVTGSITLINVVFTDGRNCIPGPPETITIVITGAVSGGSFTGSFLDPEHGRTVVPLTGTVSSTSMSLSFPGNPVTSGTFTLSLTSTTPPDSRLTGTYTGTYNAAIVPCGNPPPVPYSGSITGGLVQSGTSISGSLTISDSKRDVCNSPGSRTIIDEGPATAFVAAQVSGSSISGVIVDPQGKPNPFTATISGNTISGTVAGEFPGETLTFTMTRSSTGTPGAAIASFTASPSTINPGESSTLSWSTINAGSVFIDNGVGTQNPSGSAPVSPRQTTTYKLTATGSGGSATATATVNVATGSPARVTVSSFPRGMVQATGQGGGTDLFTITNVGGTPADVSLVPAGNFFFTVTPISFTLPGGATQTVTITGIAQPAGFAEGTVSVNPSGNIVPVRLLSATPPTADVQARATVSRSEVSGTAGQNPAGSVSFTNTGPVAIQTMAVSDQPWVLPQPNVITIQPNETKSVGFTIESSKRPDAIGGATAKFSLVFPRPSVSTKGALATTPTSSVSVSIVYVVVPGVGPGSPDRIPPGQLALFVPGLANRAKAVGDLMIANKQSSGALSDLKLYFPGSVANLPQILPNIAVTFPALIKNVFPSGPQSGTAQIRGSDLSKVSVGAVQLNTSSSAGTFGTALPVLRSDRGIGSGARMVISGVFKQPGVQTDLYVQEVTGDPATVQIDFLGENGNVIGNRPPDSIAGFGSLEIPDAVPTNAMAVRVTNNSTGAAKINAYGLVTTPNSGDAWVVSDPAVNAAAADDTFTFPVLPAASDAQTIFYATNRTASAASVSVDTRRIANRRRATPHSAQPQAVSSFTLAPYESLFAPSVSSSTAYVRITSAAGAVSVNARSVRPVELAFGSGLPALPNSAAIGSGDLKRFAGVEDASPASRSAAAPGTFRTNLVLIETAGQEATVRVTLRYTFIAGALVSAGALSTREYAVMPSQLLSINDVVRDAIGSQRDSFGDLHNMQLDVEVVGGSGRVLAYLQTIDNGSGDSVVRTE